MSEKLGNFIKYTDIGLPTCCTIRSWWNQWVTMIVQYFYLWLGLWLDILWVIVVSYDCTSFHVSLKLLLWIFLSFFGDMWLTLYPRPPNRTWMMNYKIYIIMKNANENFKKMDFFLKIVPYLYEYYKYLQISPICFISIQQKKNLNFIIMSMIFCVFWRSMSFSEWLKVPPPTLLSSELSFSNT